MSNVPINSTEITVIGGGVIGMSIAWELATSGASVRLVDAAKLGQGSSWAAAGILPAASPVPLSTYDPVESLRSISHNLYPQWSEKLHHSSGIDPEFGRCGGLYIAQSRGEMATMLAQEMYWQEHDIEFERLSAAQLADRYPQLLEFSEHLRNAPHAVHCWFTPDECTIRCSHLVQALKQACIRTGVDIVEDSPVIDIQPHATDLLDNRSVTVRCQAATWQSQYVCLTSGAWTQSLLKSLNVHSGILPVRGQILLYKFDSPPFPIIINDGHRYFVPRRDGHVLVGSCEEEVGFDCSTSDEKIDELKAWVANLMPGWNDHHFVRAWAGLRPGSFDGLPYIGALPNHPNILVAAGHYRHGVHLAPATAQIVSALIQGIDVPIDISAFHVTRGAILSGVQRQHHAAGS